MLGQAKGVRANYAKNKDIYSQNAEYGEESKQQATNAKIAAQGGIAAAVTVDVKDASMKAAEQAGNVGRKWDNIHDAKFLENQIAGLESAGADMSEFKGKEGLDYLKQIGSSQAMKAMMKDSIVDANGKSVSFATGKDGHVGMVSVDGQTKMANGVSVETGGAVAALAEGFNMTEAAIKDGHHVDIQNGKLIGNKASKEAFMKHIGNNQKNQAMVTSAPGEFLTVLQDLAEEFTPEVVADNFGKVAFAAVMGTAAKKMVVDPLKKSLPPKNTSSSKDISDNSISSNSKESKDSVNHDNTSEHRNNIKDYTEDYQKSQESRDKEIQNASNLKKQRNKLFEQGKDTSALDDKISDSYERAKGHQENMDKADRNIKAEKYIASKNIDKEAMDRKDKNGGSSKAGWLSALAMPLVNELADVMGVDKSQNLAFSTIEAGSEIIDGGFTAALDVLKATGIGGFKALRGDGDAGQYFSKNMSSAASSVMSGFSNANETMATYAIMQEFNRQQAAPQHQGFSTLPSGHHTMQAVSADMQQQAAQAQITMANNTQALSSIAPNRSYVGLSMTDADQNPVSFTTDKASRNMMINGYNTGMPAQQFGSMMQNPEAVSQFANAISQTSFSNVEAYNATNNILMDMNAQTQRANMQQKIHNNASDTRNAMQHKESLEANSQKSKEEYEI
ncbi:hypothetical protein Suden_0551 [Sulfurimonas denitrificans DSM 1251]|uniref:Uncharacterized protein n=1 Tax=Sulfurimonas denitrificans (strain ATCC 33889 / DSM 1251) TaxID=326298 RepID=Q30T51_SULDN|nr:hypothetical protein [Sulfurimonas denitrificans]ABB43830.1 hypothetical protein Suden_0551 [Sulfurimonas denitrificans DSM 1251]